MKITIESTDRIVEILSHSNGRRDLVIPGRVWEGTTDTGIPVQVVVTRIACPLDQDQSQFAAELQECREPEQEQAFPLRMVL